VPEDSPRPYHHGDLRAALLRAAEVELAEVGTERFSLRSVAKRAGVSHAAPAHHFGDVAGLMTALCAEGFRRFLDMQARREASAPPAPRDQLMAAGLGYVDFALAHPALFRLMFSSDRPQRQSPALAGAGAAAFDHLVTQVRAAGGQGVDHSVPDRAMTVDIAAAWAMAHGLADLIGSGPMQSVRSLPGPERDEFILRVMDRAMPGL
jgi:AcrR family transcriptional regulator